MTHKLKMKNKFVLKLWVDDVRDRDVAGYVNGFSFGSWWHCDFGLLEVAKHSEPSEIWLVI